MELKRRKLLAKLDMLVIFQRLWIHEKEEVGHFEPEGHHEVRMLAGMLQSGEVRRKEKDHMWHNPKVRRVWTLSRRHWAT